VDAINSYQIYVMGNVANGGAIRSTTPLNVMQALANAGGFREYADKKDVNIFRGNLLFRFNFEEFTKGRNLSQNIYLETGDVVEVH
jgi:polysaccharide export outer membrane protein